MLTVTDAAGTHLSQMLEEQGAEEGTAIRFVFEGNGIALTIDSERPGDAIFAHEGQTVLLLDAQVSELLSESTLDVEGAELTLRHPKANE